jgi:hypothetical protein
MTEFLESFATQQLLPPWKAKGVDVSCFMFKLPATSIQKYLDQFFNFGGDDRAPYHFQAHNDLQHGVLVFHHYPDIWSANVANMRRYGEDLQSWDHVSYNQMYVAVPIVRYAITADNLLVDPQIYWIQPVVICDNSSVVYGSREIVGIDMIQGDVTITTEAPSGALHIDTYINGVEKFSPRSKETLLPFVHVETGAPLPEGQGMTPAMTAAAADFLLGMAHVTANAPTAPGSPLPQEARLVTLKQFRDSYDMTRATYQAIVSSNSIMSNVGNVRFFDPDKVDIDFMWSATVSEILTSFLDLGTFAPAPPTDGGVESHDGPGWDLPHKKLNPEVCFSFTADFDYAEFETLHTFGQKR